MATEPRKPKFTNTKWLWVLYQGGIAVTVIVVALGFIWLPFLIVGVVVVLPLTVWAGLSHFHATRWKEAQWVHKQSAIERMTYSAMRLHQVAASGEDPPWGYRIDVVLANKDLVGVPWKVFEAAKYDLLFQDLSYSIRRIDGESESCKEAFVRSQKG